MPDDKCRKAEIIESVYAQTGFNKNHIKTIYELVFSEIKNSLIAGKTIELRGMGTFEVKIRNARKKARDPRTGELIPTYQHRAVCFRPGQDLKAAVWKLPENEDLG